MIIKILSHQNFFSEKKLIFKNAAFNLLVEFIWKNTYTKSTAKPINGLLVHLLKKIGWRLRLHGLSFLSDEKISSIALKNDQMNTNLILGNFRLLNMV